MQIDYTAPPTISEFMCSDVFFRLIAGPVGSGKTTGCLFELLRRASEQKPGPDGMRRTRWAIVRTTLSQLKMTVLLDALSWFRPIVTYRVSEQLLIFRFRDIYAEVYLIPLEDEEDQKRLLSMQLTGAMVSEAIETSPDLIPAIAGRCGRFPSAADGGPTWFGIIADTNFPTEGSDWHKMMEEERPPDWAIFKQPGGLDPLAENLEHLPGGREYYMRLARGNNQSWITRYVNAQYGPDPAGTAVFAASFRRGFHTVPDLTPIFGYPLIIGQDFGRNPCAVITQPDHKGRLLVLDEILCEDVGLEKAVTTFLKPKLYTDRYFGRLFAAVGDPSGVSRSQIKEENNFDALKRMGIPAYPAPTNDLDARIRAVDQLLLSQRDGGPALVIDRQRCPKLITALNQYYRYVKTKAGAPKPLPEKSHPWSDLADALQYAALAYVGGFTTPIMKRISRQRQQTQIRQSVGAAGWT